MNSVEDRLHEAAQALRTTLDPQPPPLRAARRIRVTTRHRATLAFAVAAMAIMGGVLVARAGTDDRLTTQPTLPPVANTIAPPIADGTAGNYVGRLTGDWLARRRELGMTIELVGVGGILNPPNPGRIVAQDPPAGTVTASGSTIIRLTVGEPDIDLPGELPTGLSGDHPGSGHWKLTARTVADTTTHNVPSIRLELDRTIGSAHSFTIAAADIGRDGDRPIPLLLDFGQPSSLVFGIQPATASRMVVVGADGAELFAARSATIHASGQSYLVWVIDQDRPDGARLKAIGADGATLGEIPLCGSSTTSTPATICPAN